MPKPTERTQTPREEFYNTLSHAIAIPLGVIGYVYLWANATERDFLTLLSIVLYGTSFIVLFSASTIYHFVKKPKLKKKMRIVDHISIYYLIAGTYSPVVLLLLKESKGMFIFILVWSIALIGTVVKLFFTGRFEKLSLALYLVMGWLILIDLPALIENANFTTLVWFGLGGFFYTLGAYFYANHKIRLNHVIWHIFVLLAATSHFLMIAEILT